MSRYTKEDIFRLVEEEDVEFIRLQFCDVFGKAKNIAITSRLLEKALNNECTVDMSGLDGVECGDEGEMYLYPDLDTFDIFPWRPQSGKVARLYCDVYTQNREPYVGDSRLILRRILQQALQKGMIFGVTPQIEFFLFDLDDNGMPTTKTHEYAGYLDVAPVDYGENVRRDIIESLELMRFDVNSSHHEKAPGQHEIAFRGAKADKAADMIVTYKQAVKTVSRKHGLYATFMPKPREGVNGSGMHLRFTCMGAGGNDLFRDEKDEKGLSEVAYRFIAGILAHSKEITLVTNPLVNSYKRLVPGYDAPVNVAWSGTGNNRSTMIRVLNNKNHSVGIELRSPDATCNPYLALALCIAAGLDGIEKRMELSEGVTGNLFTLSREELRGNGIERLPQTLGEAIHAFEEDAFVKEVLGEAVHSQLCKAKHAEWRAYRSCVSQWEIDQYLLGV